MEELISKLSKRYFVKQISRNEFSIIASYMEDLKSILLENDVIMINSYKQRFTVQGDFKVNYL